MGEIDTDLDQEEVLDVIYLACLEFKNENEEQNYPEDGLVTTRVDDWSLLCDAFMFLYEQYARDKLHGGEAVH